MEVTDKKVSRHFRSGTAPSPTSRPFALSPSRHTLPERRIEVFTLPLTDRPMSPILLDAASPALVVGGQSAEETEAPRLRSADRVLVQVDVHGHRVIKQLPPRRRNMMGLGDDEPTPRPGTSYANGPGDLTSRLVGSVSRGALTDKAFPSTKRKRSKKSKRRKQKSGGSTAPSRTPTPLLASTTTAPSFPPPQDQPLSLVVEHQPQSPMTFRRPDVRTAESTVSHRLYSSTYEVARQRSSTPHTLSSSAVGELIPSTSPWSSGLLPVPSSAPYTQTSPPAPPVETSIIRQQQPSPLMPSSTTTYTYPPGSLTRPLYSNTTTLLPSTTPQPPPAVEATNLRPAQMFTAPLRLPNTNVQPPTSQQHHIGSGLPPYATATHMMSSPPPAAATTSQQQIAMSIQHQRPIQLQQRPVTISSPPPPMAAHPIAPSGPPKVPSPQQHAQVGSTLCRPPTPVNTAPPNGKLKEYDLLSQAASAGPQLEAAPPTIMLDVRPRQMLSQIDQSPTTSPVQQAAFLRQPLPTTTTASLLANQQQMLQHQSTTKSSHLPSANVAQQPQSTHSATLPPNVRNGSTMAASPPPPPPPPPPPTSVTTQIVAPQSVSTQSVASQTVVSQPVAPQSVTTQTVTFRGPTGGGVSSAPQATVSVAPQSQQLGPPDTPRLTPMVVLLSLEGFKAPVNGVIKKHTNQDRGFIHEVSRDFTVFAVFDGHGEHGHDVAQFVSSSFRNLLTQEFPRPNTAEAEKVTRSLNSSTVLGWLRSSFTRVDRMLTEESRIDCTYSGCTASVAVRHGSTIYVAYVGDSKVAGFQFHGKKPFCLVETPEHSPAARNEMARIRSMGASVSEQRYQYFSKSISRIVEAGLSVSRAFGDLAARPYGLISEPDFVQIEIPEIRTTNRPMKKSQPHFPLMLIVASDGLWDTISPYEILDFVSNAQQPQDKLFESLRQIAEVAWRRRLAAEGRSDDTTAILALLQ